MSQRTKFEQKWLQGADFEVEQEARFAYLCPHGQAFAEWCEANVASIRTNPTEVSVNQLSLHLQEQFFTRFMSASRAHRTLGTARHTCIVSVYLDYGLELRELRWKVNPPLVREVPPPAVPAHFEIAGVPFGIKK